MWGKLVRWGFSGDGEEMAMDATVDILATLQAQEQWQSVGDGLLDDSPAVVAAALGAVTGGRCHLCNMCDGPLGWIWQPRPCRTCSSSGIRLMSWEGYISGCSRRIDTCC
jgi:hypothetical protein